MSPASTSGAKRVSTEYGPGMITEETGRSVTIVLDDGQTINVQKGTPGYGRIKRES